MRESDDVRKREKREVFIETKWEVEELWIMWRDEGDEENEEEKETVGNCWENKEAGTHLMAKLRVKSYQGPPSEQ